MPSKKRKSKKGGSVWCTCIMLIHPVKPKKKKRKRGRQHIYSQLAKKFKNEMQAILSKYFWTPFSPIFSPIWEDCVLARQERNHVGPPKSLPFSTLNQITTNTIFSPLFSTSFSILPIITPTKQSLNIYCQEMQDVKYKRVSNFY